MDPSAIPTVVLLARNQGWEPPSTPRRHRTRRLRRTVATALRTLATRVDAPEPVVTCTPAPAQ